MLFDPRPKIGIAKRTIATIASSRLVADRLRQFRNILVHPTQELRDPDGAFFRGGPAWPRFGAQIFPRHCWGAIPRPIDREPLPARTEWPYFDPQFLPIFWPHLGMNPQLSPRELQREVSRLAACHAPLPSQTFDRVETAIWCGAVSLHFGHMVADFSMRIAASNRIDSGTPLLFSLPPFRAPEPPAHFWQIIEHLGVERRRVLLVRTPIRVGRLYVLPQAERPFGGGPTRRHLALMDAITASDNPPERDLDYLFVSRARLAEGRFAGESYLEEMLLAAGVAVFHPETADLQRQLHLYRRARVLIFSEGSALHTLQLLGRLNAQLVVLVRRQGNQIAAASLGPRVPLLRYLPITQAQLYGLTRSGREDTRAGMSVIDEQRCIAGLKSLGIDLSPFWDSTAYSKRRDADIAAWISDRKTAGLHPREQAVVEEQLRALSLQIQ